MIAKTLNLLRSDGNPKNNIQTANIKRDTYDLCLPEGRKVNTVGHRTAEDFVRRRLQEVGCVPYRGDSYDLPYEGGGLSFINFAGVVPGKDSSLSPLLIGAHYDSVICAPCADDNGVAVAVCLEVARVLGEAEEPLDRDVIIAIFDAEEPPFFCGPNMGSRRFYHEQLDERGVHFALIHDLIGHDVSLPLGNQDVSVSFLKEALFIMGAESHPQLSTTLAQSDAPKGIKIGATLNRYVGDMSDHGVFRENGVPYLFCSCGMWAHYHQPTDTPDRLNYTKSASIAQLSLQLLETIDKLSLEGSANGEDHSLAYEIASFKKLMGPLLPIVLKKAHISELKTRHDIEQVVSLLMSMTLRH